MSSGNNREFCYQVFTLTFQQYFPVYQLEGGLSSPWPLKSDHLLDRSQQTSSYSLWCFLFISSGLFIFNYLTFLKPPPLNASQTLAKKAKCFCFVPAPSMQTAKWISQMSHVFSQLWNYTGCFHFWKWLHPFTHFFTWQFLISYDLDDSVRSSPRASHLHSATALILLYAFDAILL